MSTNYKVIKIRQVGTNYIETRFSFLKSTNIDFLWSTKNIDCWYLNEENPIRNDRTDFKLNLKVKL